ncbi:hypothetical protein ETAA8_40970 [Anatilimnocola aggregata]|uniref:Uncharacterized protein n=1 Tax=Anatilimnocola aggregata TaxID=2528021 RepID=A0A517YFK1_9BACT|nr:SGNH/GDSL hydrolase family protein [Anatilimnocola aggregata]QDU28991.1 hypothetical protein ETAA8_40970 [Anatilimnocola aggregata]
MFYELRNIAVVLLALLCAPLYAQQGKPALPSVLIIGDAVYQQHAGGTINELKDQAKVQFAKWPKGVLPSSTNAIEHLDLLLGIKDSAGKAVPEDKRSAWDLIHFNVGLGDLIYCVPNLKSHRAQPHNAGGVIRTGAKQYENNLDTLVRLLRQKAPHAKIVWANTTPIRHSRENVFKLGTEVEYNRIAEQVMTKHSVPVNDMYSYARSIIDMDKPAAHGVDPFHFDGKPIVAPIINAISRELNMPIKKPVEGLSVPASLDRGAGQTSK